MEESTDFIFTTFSVVCWDRSGNLGVMISTNAMGELSNCGVCVRNMDDVKYDVTKGKTSEYKNIESDI